LIKNIGLGGTDLKFHVDPLSYGGHPKSVKNLWPEPYLTEFNAHTKDKFENYLHKQICNGSMSLSDAQKQIATDWKTNCIEAKKC
jgi:hypothetical protein